MLRVADTLLLQDDLLHLIIRRLDPTTRRGDLPPSDRESTCKVRSAFQIVVMLKWADVFVLYGQASVRLHGSSTSYI